MRLARAETLVKHLAIDLRSIRRSPVASCVVPRRRPTQPCLQSGCVLGVSTPDVWLSLSMLSMYRWHVSVGARQANRWPRNMCAVHPSRGSRREEEGRKEGLTVVALVASLLRDRKCVVGQIVAFYVCESDVVQLDAVWNYIGLSLLSQVTHTWRLCSLGESGLRMNVWQLGQASSQRPLATAGDAGA